MNRRGPLPIRTLPSAQGAVSPNRSHRDDLWREHLVIRDRRGRPCRWARTTKCPANQVGRARSFTPRGS